MRFRGRDPSTRPAMRSRAPTAAARWAKTPLRSASFRLRPPAAAEGSALALLPGRNCEEAEADAVDRVARLVPEAERGRAVHAVAEPAAAPDHPVRASFKCRGGPL